MKILEGLDDAQLAGVTAGGGLVVMPSGAGTGKTRVLTTRIVHLVAERKQDPACILAMTFTNKAAREMSERAMAMGEGMLEGVRIMTMHSLSARLLRRHSIAAGLASSNWVISSPPERFEAMAEAVDSTGVLGKQTPGDEEAEDRRKSYIEDCERRIDRWKENGLTTADIGESALARRGTADVNTAKVYLAYDQLMRGRNMLDFADLTLLAVRLLDTNPAILAEESGRIGWLLVDEAQDLNRIQLRLIRLLCSVHKNLHIVGDDDQSLYGFRSAVPRLMDRAPVLLPEFSDTGVQTVRLVTNRRCTDDVLTPANLLVGYNKRDTLKELKSGRRGVPVSVSGYPTDGTEAEAVAKRAAGLIERGVLPQQIAILGRSRFPMQVVERAFLKANLPHCMQAGNGLLERAEVQDVMAYLRLAMDPTAGWSFSRIAARPIRGLGAAAVEAVLGLARQRNLPVHEALAICADANAFRGKANAAAARLGQHLSTLARASRNGERSEDMVQYVLDDIGYRVWALTEKDAPRSLTASFTSLIDIAREQPTFSDFLSDLCVLADAEDRALDGVHIGTLHGSKGLEWDYVFIVAFEEGVLPHYRALEADEHPGDPDDPWDTSNGGGIEEERRLAHVGLTRARLEAHVSFAMQRGLGPMCKPSKPSRFLREAELCVPRVQTTFAQVQSARGSKGKVKQKRTRFV